MTKMKFTQLIDSITNENEWINKLHIVTDDKNELWLFKSEINDLLVAIGYEGLHPRDINDYWTLYWIKGFV